VDTVRDLITRSSHGDDRAYGEVVRRFQDMAVGYGYSLLRDFHLAEDAAQEAFVHAYGDLASLRDPSAFPGWFRRIVYKFCDRIRRSQRAPMLTLDAALTEPSRRPTPEGAALAGELRERVESEIESLPERQRSVTVLFYMGEHSHREIGDMLGVPVNTVKTRLHRARERLTEGMTDMVRETLHDRRPSRNEEFRQKVTDEIAELRERYAASDADARREILAPSEPGYARDRFENPDPTSIALTEHDARVLVAMQHGYAHWDKMEGYMRLDPGVQDVIEAIQADDLDGVRQTLSRDPAAANPHWEAGYEPPRSPRVVSWVNDCIPLFRVSGAVFRGDIPAGTSEYAMTKALIAAGADPDYFDGYPMVGAVSYNTLGVVQALLEGGAAVDGVDGDGLPMAYALFFGFTEVAEALASAGATLDLRFAAGVGDLAKALSFFDVDGGLIEGAGTLADPYGHEHKQQHGTVHRCDRTRENVLSQALLFACLHARLDVAEALIGHGADVNAFVPGHPEGSGTVLHRLTLTQNGGATRDSQAVEERRLPVVRFLLEHGADVGIREPGHDATALGWALHMGCDRIAAELRDHGATE
jgi:RNA polymerase sigma factor (sigma-70 family)